MTTDNKLLELKNLSLSYAGHPVLQNLSFSIAAGSFTGIAGCSGSGKTSLLSAVAGTLPPSASLSGQILWSGKSLQNSVLSRNRDAGVSIAVLPQQAAASLYPLADIGSQLRLVQKANRYGNEADLCQLLDRLGLASPRKLLKLRPGEISGGQARRVCLAMCLMQRPGLLLADEPTAGLDALACSRVLEELQLLRRECGTAILLTSHDLGFLAACCSNFIIMENGRIAEQSGREILLAPRHPHTRHLLAAVPVLYREREDSYAADSPAD